MGRYRVVTILLFLFIIYALMIVQCGAQTPLAQPSQVELGDVKGTIVTLYYYNFETGGKGAIVPLPDGQNPQEVQWDSAKAAPGTFTFYKVPFGIYYMEAVHGNHSYFAIANVTEGTTTANVAIPPEGTGIQWQPVGETSATATPSPVPTVLPPPPSMPSPTPSPGLTTISAIAGLTLVSLYVVMKKK
jgi:hypothetical protein